MYDDEFETILCFVQIFVSFVFGYGNHGLIMSLKLKRKENLYNICPQSSDMALLNKTYLQRLLIVVPYFANTVVFSYCLNC